MVQGIQIIRYRLTDTVESNISTIVEIESKYLSGLEDEAKALSMINEKDYEDDGE